MGASTERTSNPPSTPTKVRLSDQARVSVQIARAMAAGRVTAGHLLAGLAAEPEGNAGRELRRLFAGIDTRLGTSASLAAPGLVGLDAVLLATPAWPRPLWSEDLLAALLRVGGESLHELTDSLGIALTMVEAAAAADPPPVGDSAERNLTHETFAAGSLRASGFDADADRAVAMARARGHDAAILLGLLEPGSAALSLPGAATIDDVVAAVTGTVEPPITPAALLPATLTVLLRGVADR